MSKVERNSLSSSLPLDGRSGGDAPSIGGEADRRRKKKNKKSYGWRNVKHLLDDNNGSRRSKKKSKKKKSQRSSEVQQQRRSKSRIDDYTTQDSESSGGEPYDLMAIPSMIAPPSVGASEGKRSKHQSKYDHPVARQRKVSKKRKDSDSSDDDHFIGGGRPKKSLREDDLMAIPSMIAPPKPSPKRRSDIPQQRPVPKPSPLPKHPGRRARSFMSPRDRRLAAGKNRRRQQQQQQNNTVAASPMRNMYQQQSQRMNHVPVDTTTASTTSIHEESQPWIASPLQHYLPHANIGAPFRTPQYSASMDFNDAPLQYAGSDVTSLEGIGDHQSSGIYRRSQQQQQQQNNTVASSSVRNIHQQSQRMNHVPVDTIMTFPSTIHKESQSWTASPLQHYLPHANISAPFKTPQYSASVDFNNVQYATSDVTSLEGMGNYQSSEIFPPLSPEKSLFSQVTEASESPPKSLFSHWLPPPLHKNGKYSSSDEDDSTLEGLSTMYSSMIPSDSGLPATQVQTINADDVEFHGTPFNDQTKSPDTKLSNSVDLVSRCPESPMTPHDQSVYGHLHKNLTERNVAPSRTIDNDNEFPDLPISSTIVQDEVVAKPGSESAVPYPPQDTLPTNLEGKQRKPSTIKKTKLKSAVSRQHPRKKLDFNDLDAGSSELADDSSKVDSNRQSSSTESTVEPGKRRWKFEELMESKDEDNASDMGPSAELNNSSFSMSSNKSDQMEKLNKQDNFSEKRKWKFEELLASPDDGLSNHASSDDELNKIHVPSESDYSVLAEDGKRDDDNDLDTPGKRKWKFEEILASNDDHAGSDGADPFVSLIENSAHQESLNYSATKDVKRDDDNDLDTPGKRKWKFEEILASNDDHAGSDGADPFVSLIENSAHQESLNYSAEDGKRDDDNDLDTPGKRKWKFEEILASNDDHAGSDGADPFVSLIENSAHQESLNYSAEDVKQDDDNDLDTPGKRKWRFEEILASNDDHAGSDGADPFVSLIDNNAHQESLNYSAEDVKQDDDNDLDTPGKRKWKFEEILASNDDHAGSDGADPFVSLIENSAHQESLNYSAEDVKQDDDNDLDTPGKRKWRFEEILASNDAGSNGTDPFVSLIDDSAHQESTDTYNSDNIVETETLGGRKWKFEELLASNDDRESSLFIGTDNEAQQSDSDDSILNIVLDKQNNQKSPIAASEKRRWKFEDLLASNENDEESSSARLSKAFVGSQPIHNEEIESIQSQSAIIDEAKLHDIITIFQSHVRGAIVRKSYHQCHSAALTIQMCVRTHNLKKVRRWEEAIVKWSNDLPAAEVDRIQKYFLACNGNVRLNLQQRQNYLDYHSSIIGMLNSRISEMNALRRYEQYHRFLRSVVQMQANVRARQPRKPLTTIDDNKSQEIGGKLPQIERYAKMKVGFILLQARYRGVLCRKNYKSNDLVTDQIERYSQAHAALVSFQALFRGALCRKRLSSLHSAAILLQHYIRAMLQRRRYRLLLSGLMAFQATVRGVLERKTSDILKKSVVSVQSRIRSFTMRSRYLKARACIILIQKTFRGMQAMKRMRRLHFGASSIQSVARAFVVRRKYANLRRGVISFQALVRGLHARNTAAIAISALMNIQCHLRTFIQKKKYNKMRMAAILVQSKIRAFKQQTQFRTIVAATLCIQSFVRGLLVRKYVNDLREENSAVTKIQSVFRMHQCVIDLLRKKEEHRIASARREAAAAVRVQSAVRMWAIVERVTLVDGQMYRNEMSQVVEEIEVARRCDAADVIQSIASSLQFQRELASLRDTSARADMARRSAAAVVIQSFRRSVVCQRVLEDMKIRHKEQIVKRMAAATTIQSKVRSLHCKEELSQRRLQASKRSDAATKLQSHWRSFTCRKELSNDLREEYSAVTKIQSVFRMHQCVHDLLRKKEGHRIASARREAAAAVRVQSAVRMWMCRHVMSQMVEERDEARRFDAAVVIQSITRSLRCQRELASLKEASARADLARLSAAVVVIQSFRRSVVCQRMLEDMKIRHKEQIVMRMAAATTIQSKVRSLHCKKELSQRRLQASKRSDAATKLQSHWRSFACRKELCNDLREEYSAVTKIQSVFRMHQCVHDLLRKKEEHRIASARREAAAAVRVQSAVRMWMCRHVMSQMVEERDEARRFDAAVVIQSITRSLRCQRELASLKEASARADLARLSAAVVVIQSFRRSVVCQRMLEDMKIRHKEQIVKRMAAATTIQSKVRSLHCKKELSQRRLQASKRSDAATKLQSHWRSFACRKELSLASRHAATIQRCYNRYRMTSGIKSAERMKMAYANDLREEYSAVTKIQSVFRMHQCVIDLLRKKEEHRIASARREAAAAVRVQSAVRMWMCRHLMSQMVEERDEARRFDAAVVIQSITRSLRCQRELASLKEASARADLARLSAAVVVIQSFRRSVVCQRMLEDMKIRHKEQIVKRMAAATTIQSKVRSLHCKKELSQRRLQASKRSDAATKLQSHWRSFACRKELSLASRHAATIQRCYNRYRMTSGIKSAERMKMAYANDLREEYSAVTKIQSVFRMHQCVIDLLRKKEGHRIASARREAAAAVRVQSAVRMWMCRHVMSQMVEEIEVAKRFDAAVVIQSIARSLRCQRELASLKDAVARADLARLSAAVVVIQSFRRSVVCQRMLEDMKIRHKEQIVKRMAAATTIQSKVRSLHCKKELSQRRLQASKRSDAATKLQSHWRSFACSKELSLASRHAATIQRCYNRYRMTSGIKSAERMKMAYANDLREEYSAVTKIQSVFRMHQCVIDLLRKKEEHRIASARREAAAAVRVQSAVRMWMCRHVMSQMVVEIEVAKRFDAAVVIQSIARSLRCQRELASLKDAVARADLARLSAAVVVIQSFRRSVVCQRMLEDMKIRHKEQIVKRMAAATTIQSKVRSLHCKKELSQRRLQASKRSDAATKLQSHWRSFACRKELSLASRHAATIQRCYNRYRMTSGIKSAERMKMAYANDLREEYSAVTKIQSVFRMHQCVIDLLRKKEEHRIVSARREAAAAVRVQSAVRMWMCRHVMSQMVVEIEVAKRFDAAVVIQSIARSLRCQRELASLKEAVARANLARLSAAVVVIQSFRRSVVCQRMLEDMKIRHKEQIVKRMAAATTIQSKVRSLHCKKELSQRRLQASKRSDAATKLQSHWRSFACRKELSLASRHAATIQRCYNRYRMTSGIKSAERMKMAYANDLREEYSAVNKIQSVFRMHQCVIDLLRKKEGHRIASARREAAAAVRVQSAVRMWMCRHVMSQMVEEIEVAKRFDAAVVIQSIARSLRCQRELASLKDAVARADLARLSAAVVVIQSFRRSVVCQRMLEDMKIRHKEQIVKRMAAATTIQSKVRSLHCKKELSQRRLQASKRSDAATKLQSHWRSFACRKELSLASRHAATIQRCYNRYRMTSGIKSAERMKMAYANDLREEYSAVNKIQSVFRMHQCVIDLLRKKEGHRIASARREAAAAVRVQSAVRMWMCRHVMSQMVEEIEVAKRFDAAVVIQSIARSLRCQRELASLKDAVARADLARLSAAVVVIQSFRRSVVCQRMLEDMKIRHKEQIVKRMAAATTIQSKVRSLHCKKELSQRRLQASKRSDAATKLQSHWRSFACRKELSLASRHAATIQRCYNRYRMTSGIKSAERMKMAYANDLREEYSAVNKIQSVFRMHQCVIDLLRKKEGHRIASARREAAAAVRVQSAVRMWMCRHVMSQMVEEIEVAKRFDAAVVIQSIARSLRCQRELASLKDAVARADLARLSAAVVVIQSFRRSVVCQRMLEDMKIRHKEQIVKRMAAATTIQSKVRSLHCKKELSQRRLQASKRSDAATKLQSHWRSFACRKELSLASRHAATIQRCYNRYRMTSGIKSAERMKMAYANDLREEYSAVNKIQSVFRMHQCVIDLLRKKEGHRIASARREAAAAVRVQSAVRMWMCRHVMSQMVEEIEVAKRFDAAVVIQSIARSLRCQRELASLKDAVARADLARLSAAVVVIQSFRRSVVCQRMLEDMKIRHKEQIVKRMAAATTIQSKVRSLHCKKELSQRRLQASKRSDAATKLQSHWRSFACRKELSLASRHAATIQRCYNRYRMTSGIKSAERMKMAYANDLREEYSAVTKIQSVFRMHQCVIDLLRKKEGHRIVSARREAAAAVRVQSAVRMWMCRHLMSQMVEERDEARRFDAAVVIQSIARSLRCQRELASLKEASASVDHDKRLSYFLSQFSSNDLAHLTRVQALFRGNLLRMKYRNAVASAACIQKRWKCNSDVVVVSYSVYLKSVLTIQKKFKRFYSIRHSAAKKIQLSYLSRRMKRNLLKVQRSVNLIQRAVRGHQSRSFVQRLKFIRYHSASTKIQSIVRAHLLRSEFRLAVTNITKIQRCYRQFRVTFFDNVIRDERTAYVEMLKKWHREAMAVRIQTVARSWLRHQKLSSTDKRINVGVDGDPVGDSVVTDTSDVGDSVATVEVDGEPVGDSVVTDTTGDSVTTGTRTMICPTSLDSHNASARVIQSHWRSSRCNKELLVMRTAAVVIQSLVRSWRCQRELRTLRSKAAEAKLLANEAAAITLQTFARSLISKKQISRLREAAVFAEMQRTEIKLLAARKIQSIVRAHRCRRNMQLAFNNASKIQRCYLCYKRDKLERAHQDEKKNYAAMLERCHQESMATRIQAFIRLHLCRERLLKLKASRHDKMSDEMTSIAAAVVIQSVVRSWLSRRRELCTLRSQAVKTELLAKNAAAITLQTFARSISCKKHFSKLLNERNNETRTAAAVIQSLVRSWRCQRELRTLRSKAAEAKLLANEAAAITLQTFARSLISKKQISRLREAAVFAEMQRTEIKLLAARKIQSIVRAHRCRRNMQLIFNYASKIQRCYLRYKSNTLERAHQDEKKNYAAMLERCHQESMATRIQTVARSWLCKSERDTADSSATIIQSKWRSHRCKAEIIVRRTQFERRKLIIQSAAAVVIQSIVRSRSCRRELTVRKENLRVREAAAVTIQSLARSYNVRIVQSRILLAHLLMRSKSVILIQSIARMYLLRSRLDVAQKAACIIQHAWKHFVSSLQDKILVVSDLLTESRYSYRSHLLMPMHKARTLLPRDLKRLNRIRSITPHLPRRYECGVFIQEVMNSVAMVIQSFARRYLVLRQVKKLHKAAATVQASWRTSRLRKLDIAVLKIQSAIRGRLVRRNVSALLSSTITSQRYSRIENEVIAGDEKAEQNAAILIQRFFRVGLAKNSVIKLRLERGNHRMLLDEDDGMKRSCLQNISTSSQKESVKEAEESETSSSTTRKATQAETDSIMKNIYQRARRMATKAETDSLMKTIYQRAEAIANESTLTKTAQSEKNSM